MHNDHRIPPGIPGRHPDRTGWNPSMVSSRFGSGGASELSLHLLDYWKVIRARLPMVLLVLCTVVVTAAAITYATPRQYRSSATMEVRDTDKTLNLFGGGPIAQNVDPRFLTTQFEIIQKKEVLYPVIKSLDLAKKWGSPNIESAYNRLRSMIRVQETRNTRLIEIIVYSTDPVEAANIANSIADEYQRRRLSEIDVRLEDSLKELRNEVDRQKRIVDQRFAEMTKIRRDLGIRDLSPDNVEDSAQVESQLLLGMEQKVDEQRSTVSTLRARTGQISQLDDEQIIRSFEALEIADPRLAELVPLMNSVDVEISKLSKSGLGPRHPAIASLEEQKKTLKSKLSAQVQSVRTAMEANLRIAEGVLAALEQRLKEAREVQQSSKNQSSSYYEAKKAFIDARKLQEAAELKLSTERMQRSLPDSPISIWEKAEPSYSPAKPNVALNMLLAVVVGTVFGIGLAFLLEYLDTSVKSVADAEQQFQLKVLGVIPDGLPESLHLDPQSVYRESFRIIRANIELGLRTNPEKNAFCIVSSCPGEGKSTVTSQLAMAYTSLKKRVLIIDADFRRPAQHVRLKLNKDPGLSQYLAQRCELADVLQPTASPYLAFIGSGKTPADPSGLLQSQRMGELLAEQKRQFDLVLIDVPPVLGLSDALVVCDLIDRVILLAEHRKYPASMLARSLSLLQDCSAEVVGLIINRFDVKSPEYQNYYTAYYSYYGGNGRTRRRKPANAASEASASLLSGESKEAVDPS